MNHTERARSPILTVIAPKDSEHSIKNTNNFFTIRRINIGPLGIEMFTSANQNDIKIIAFYIILYFYIFIFENLLYL